MEPRWIQILGCYNNIGTISYSTYQPYEGYSASILPSSFISGSTNTQVKATKETGEELTLNLNHESMVIGVDNPSYPYENPCFNIAGNGHLSLEAPSGYLIEELLVRCYRTYDNLDFYMGNAVDEKKSLEKKFTAAESAPWWILYDIAANSQNVYIHNHYSGAVSTYEIVVHLNEA